jgi:hypothetical protein
MNTIKTEDLIRFLYNETSNKENLLIESALAYDFKLKEEYNSLKEAIDELKSFSLSPSEQSVNRILSHLT